MEYHYIDSQGNRRGPVSYEDLIRIIDSETLVWHPNLANWTKASDLPEFQSVWVNTNAHTHMPPPFPSDQQSRANENLPMPNDYFIYSILTTICCCMPLGILAIYYSYQTKQLYYKGRVHESYKYSDRTKLILVVSLVLGIIFNIIYTCLMFVKHLF